MSCFFTARPSVETHAHEGHRTTADAHLEGVVGDWLFRPEYGLPRHARYEFEVPFDSTESVEKEFERDSLPLRLAGLSPTERIRNLVPTNKIPRESFTFEAWINNHVNQPVGFAVVAGGKESPERTGWALAYHSLYGSKSRLVATIGNQDEEPVVISDEHDSLAGFKEYWWHTVLTVDGQSAKLYLNGELKAETALPSSGITWTEEPELEIDAYLEHEPEMKLANLVNHARLYKRAIGIEEIQDRFLEFKSDVEQGIVYPGAFHFSAGPYLNYATQNSIRVLWETDAPAQARIEWGESRRLGNSATIASLKRIQEYEITDLKPETPYFYRITAGNKAGEEISSGILTFQTAVKEEAPFRFVVIGDTETRPHINHAISKKIWGERPNFVVVLGDLTDGGFKDHKWQWNHEYFSGVAGLCSRVPFYPVPGNGEGDLFWYKRFHSLPGNESPYSFRYGNADFFMLDSNLKDLEFKAGKRQHKWLEEKLQASTATWKFVCFHHAPYCSDEDDYGNTWDSRSVYGDESVRDLVPLFEKYQVDMVMFGHIHSYERSRQLTSSRTDEDGVVYLLCGGGGGNLEDFAPNATTFSSKVHRGHHYCLMNIENEIFELKMYDLGGAMLDFLKIDKSK